MYFMELAKHFLGGCLYGAYSPGKEFELILTIKMETRHSIEGSLGSEFVVMCYLQSLCSYDGLKSQDLKTLWAFFGKTTPYGKIFKILFQKFSPPYQSMLCWNVVKFVRWEIVNIMHYLPDKKHNFGCLLNCRYCVDFAKICQVQP